MGLRAYVMRRLFLLAPTLIGLSLLTFVISHMVPGDPVRLAAGPRAGPDEIEALRREFGYDQPLPMQYLRYMQGLLQGNLGRSIMNNHRVVEDLRQFFPATLELVLASMVIGLALGIPAGAAAAFYRDRWPDHAARFLALSSISLPAFWLAIVLQLGLALYLGWFPVSGRFDVRQTLPPSRTGLLLVDSILALDWRAVGIALRHLALPAFTQSLLAFALVTRMLRTEMVEVFSQDFVRVARAKGLSERLILTRHVMRNALIPTVSMTGFLFAFLIGGSVLVESVFDWPGIGLYATKSALTLDFQPIMGISLFVGLLVMLTNLLTDLAYGVVDPRIHYR